MQGSKEEEEVEVISVETGTIREKVVRRLSVCKRDSNRFL